MCSQALFFSTHPLLFGPNQIPSKEALARASSEYAIKPLGNYKPESFAQLYQDIRANYYYSNTMWMLGRSTEASIMIGKQYV